MYGVSNNLLHAAEKNCTPQTGTAIFARKDTAHLRFKTTVLKIILVLRGWPELQSSRVDVEASVSGGETSWDKLIILRHAEKKKT